MEPIQNLLSRIRWDREFGQGQFEIGYYDRVAGNIRRIAFQEVSFPAGEPHCFRLLEPDGRALRIPFHRVREVCRDGKIIWRRPSAAALPGKSGDDSGSGD